MLLARGENSSARVRPGIRKVGIRTTASSMSTRPNKPGQHRRRASPCAIQPLHRRVYVPMAVLERLWPARRVVAHHTSAGKARYRGDPDVSAPSTMAEEPVAPAPAGAPRPRRRTPVAAVVAFAVAWLVPAVTYLL